MHLLTSTFLTAILATLHLTTAAVIERAVPLSERDLELRAAEAAAQRNRTCGSTAPPEEIVKFTQQLNTGFQAMAAHAPIVVNTYFHVVTSRQKQGLYSQTQLNNQITYMNNAYGSHGITFKLLSTDFTTNDAWSTGNADSQMKPALRKGTYSSLNVYFLSDLSGGLLGICPFPTTFSSPSSSTYTQDGCSVLADSLPGGSATKFNLGGTAAHEVGHWFGLFHVFQGQSCSGQGDGVADTPVQSTATSGCPASKDSCPNQAGLDNVRNYMDYSDDRCYELFTSGQEKRMFQMWDTYRAGK